MELQEIRKIVENEYTREYRAKLADGGSKIVRLFNRNGYIYIIAKGKRRYCHELVSWYDHYDKWTALRLVERKENDWYRLFMKRAKDGLKMLTESGLWPDIKESIEHFLSLPENEQKALVNDIKTDCYERFYKQTFDNGKYAWVNCYQVFESFASKRCWKSIAYSKWDRERYNKEVEAAIKDKKDYSKRWTNGYDNDLTLAFDGTPRGWYSEEYRGCGNGHYYLLFDATHAIFYEND